MAFTVFDSFAEVYDDFDESDPEDLRDRAMLADAIMMYGLHGVEADLPKHLRRVFKAMKNAIDNSKDARGRGGKGGRPRKKPVSDKPETQVSESENPNLTCPELSCTDLDCAGEVRAPDAPGAPTLEEAVEYFGANCLGGDPEAFFDFYASQGWMKSSGMPIADWRAQARQWHRMQRERDADARSRGKPTSAEVSAAKFTPVPKLTPEEELAQIEEEARRYGIAL